MAHRISPPRLSGYVAMAAAVGLSVWLIAGARRRKLGDLGADRPVGSSSSTPCNDHRQAETFERRRLEDAGPLLGQPASGRARGTGHA